MFKFVCVALLVCSAYAGEIKFTDCGNHEILKLSANECNGDCTIVKGKEFKLDAEILANQDTSKVTVAITANVNGLVIPLPDVDTDGCHTIKCPVVKGQKYPFTYSLMVPKILPTLKSTVVTAKISGEHGLLACLTLNGSVVD